MTRIEHEFYLYAIDHMQAFGIAPMEFEIDGLVFDSDWCIMTAHNLGLTR